MIMAEVSDKERSIAGKAHKDPLFASKSSAVQIDNRSVCICADAVEMTGTIVHACAIINNGQPGGTCQNTNTVGKHLLASTSIHWLREQGGDEALNQ